MSKTIYKEVEVEVVIDAADVLDELADVELAELVRERGLFATGAGKGDPNNEQRVEQAYMAARADSTTPQAIKDLLWHVHGRAI